jgi:hypothetical protein
MFVSVPDGACGLPAAVFLVARGVNPEWSYAFGAEDAWRLICANVREGRLHAYLGLEFGETCEAERGQFAGLESRFHEVSTKAVAIRDSLGRKHLFGELFFYENDLQAIARSESALRTNAVAPKGRGGRRRRYDPELIEAEVIRLMELRGEFDIRDKQWNCQARLETELMTFCEGEFGEEPVRSTLQTPIANGLAKWRER